MGLVFQFPTRLSSLASMAVCLACFAAAAQEPTFDPSKVLSEAMALTQAGEVARARQLAEEVRARDPLQGGVQNQLGRVYEKLGDNQKAREAYQKAIDLAPRDEDYYLDLVSLLFLQERPRSAVALLKNALQKIPDSYALTVALGTARQASGEKHEALRIFERAMKMRPDQAAAFVLYGKQATALGQTQAAIQALVKATQIDAKDARARHYLGVALVSGGRPDSALGEFRKALEIDPHYALARYELAKGLERENKMPEAVDEYCRALKDDPSLIQVYYRLYRSYNRLGQKDKAQEALKTFRVHQNQASGITVDPTRLTPD